MKTLKIFLLFTLLLNPYFEAKSNDGALGKNNNAMSSPWGVLIMSTVGAIYSGVLYKGAAEQEKEAQKNIEKIDKIILAFEDSYASFCPNGRNKLEEPKCYCYTSDGKQNTARSNSQTCTALWASDSYKLSGAATDYNLTKYDPNVLGCVNVNGDFDEACKCKKLVNAKGENACKKTTTITVNPEAYNPTLASSTGLSQVTGVLDNLFAGKGLGSISNANLNTNAINSKKITDSLIKKLNSSGTKVPTITEDNAHLYAKATLGEKNINSGMQAYSSGAMGQIANHNPGDSMKKAVEQVKSEFKIDTSGSGKGLKKSAANKKDDFNFDLGGSESSAGNNTVEGFIEEENKNYKYTNSDITTNEDVSIFEIINNRYVQSGLKRLFDDETSSVEKK